MAAAAREHRSTERTSSPDAAGAPGWLPLRLFPRVTRRFLASFVIPGMLLTLAAAILAVLITGQFLRRDAERNHNALAAAFATAAAQGAYTLDSDYLTALAESIVKAPQITEVRIDVPGLKPVAARNPAAPPAAAPRIHDVTLGIPSPIAGAPSETIGRITITMTYDSVRSLSLILAACSALFVTLSGCALIFLSLMFVRRTALTPLAAFASVVSASPDEYVAPHGDETEIDSLFRFSRQKVEALATSERRMSTLVANVPGIVFRYRGTFTHGRMEYISPAIERLLGYTREEMMDLDIINMRPPWLLTHSSEGHIDRLRHAFDDGAPAQSVYRAVTRTGAPRWLYISSRRVEEFADGVFCLEGVAIDVTEQHENERELADAVAREFKLQEQLAETRRHESLGRLAGGIAHDFNNILGAARSFADLITHETDAGSRPHGYALKIVTACDRAAEVVRQILLFTRAQETTREPVSADQILNELEPLLDGRLPSHTQLVIRHDAAVPPVTANASQLMQVLMNLAINGSDALEGRPGTVSISTCAVAGGEITFEKGINASPGGNTLFCATGSLRPDTAYVAFVVKDTGAGISAAVAAKIFDPFFTTKENRKGSGLGLAVAQGIITAHDGVITALSTPGAGSTFQVYLPASDRLPAATGSETVKGRSVRGDERILIVDDDMDVADGLSLSLTRLGYETAPVYSPEEALEIFSEDPAAWDMVITDQVMPGLAGVDLVRALKKIRPDLATILCSGFSENLTEAAARDAGVDAFLHKPVPVTDVAMAIRRIKTVAVDA